MSDKNEENILYGGPEPPLIDDESQSLGEVLLKKLQTINPNDVMFVSKSWSSHNYLPLLCQCFLFQLSELFQMAINAREMEERLWYF